MSNSNVFKVTGKEKIKTRYEKKQPASDYILEWFTGAWNKTIYDEVYPMETLKEEMAEFRFELHHALPILNDWAKLSKMQQAPTNQGLSREEISTELAHADSKETE